LSKNGGEREMKMKLNVEKVLKDEKLSYSRNTDQRMNEAVTAIENQKLNESFYKSNSKKITKDSKTTATTNDVLEYLADYILESENLTTKKNEYNILDQKRLKDVEHNEQALPSYFNENEETVVEGELTNALINRERLLKYQDKVYQLLKNDYELINNGATLEDLWFYQTLENEDAKRLVEDSYNLIEYYLDKIQSTENKRKIQVYRRRIKEILFGDIGSIVRSYTKLEPYQKRQGIKANNKLMLEFGEDIATNKHFFIFKSLVADKSSIIKPTELIPIIDLEIAIQNGIESGYLNIKDIEIVRLLKNHYKGDLITCLKIGEKYKTNRRRFKKLINKLEKVY
jgi:hypothetical protein